MHECKDPKDAPNKPNNLQWILFSFLSLLSLFTQFSSSLRSRYFSSGNKKRMAPMAPGAWPLFGHLSFFKSSKPTHVTFGDMVEVLGPVFMMKLGSYNVLIISSQEVAKECFTVHDKVIDRIDLTASKILGYDGSFLTFSSCGPYWKEMRKIATWELFSTTTTDKFKDSREREVDMTFRDLYMRWEQEGGAKTGVLVDMKREFQDLLANISLMMIVGKRYFGASPNCEAGEARRCGKLIQEFFNYFGLYLLSDVMPSLGWSEWKVKRDMKRTAKELDQVVEAWVEEHKKRRDDIPSCEKHYLDLLIEIFENREIPGTIHDAHTTTKAICLNMVFAGSEPAIVVLVWVVSLLVNNPHELRKAQEELDQKIGRDKVVEESDLNDLTYLHAIVKETLRLYPPLPLTAYRYVMEDFDITHGNFHVPAGKYYMHLRYSIVHIQKIRLMRCIVFFLLD
ncbi:xanthotoxin 5-hydroxylase CYP82C2 [Brassica rapa]|uniref:xanthotoxin 5-hydroxylase CYP82C2 n=1 Tax=Brassica campestris TaxID=3711 RepID=UPI00142DFA6D|nr:xanthotoxin 5-hydroxylase CYP82C2 [Brassica rapa]